MSRPKTAYQSGLHHEREDLLVPLRKLFLISDPGNQAAVDADLRELAEFVDDLLGGSDQGIAAVTRDEMRLVSVQGLGVQGLIVRPKIFEDCRPLQSPFSLNVVTQIVVGLFLGFATRQ